MELTKFYHYIYEVRHWFRHQCSAPWQNQTGSDIKLALHHKIVSSLLSLKTRSRVHRLPRVDSVAPNVGHSGINKVLPLCTKFVIDSVTYVLHPGKSKPEVVSNSHCTSKLYHHSSLQKIQSQVHRLPRVDSVAPNVGHDGINEVLPLRIYEVRHWFRHLCSAP